MMADRPPPAGRPGRDSLSLPWSGGPPAGIVTETPGEMRARAKGRSDAGAAFNRASVQVVISESESRIPGLGPPTPSGRRPGPAPGQPEPQAGGLPPATTRLGLAGPSQTDSGGLSETRSRRPGSAGRRFTVSLARNRRARQRRVPMDPVTELILVDESS